MTSYEPRGRKVTDPKPVRPNYKKRVKPASGLEKAWEEMNMAKSVLRRAELNLREVDYPPVSNISATSVQIDKVPKYFIEEKPVKEQVIVDKYGRTSHLKMKFTESKRKIVPLEDRFQEDAMEAESVKSRKRSPLREPNVLHPSEGHLSRAYTSLSSKLKEDDDPSNLLDKYNQKYKKTERDDDIFRRDAYYKNPTKDSNLIGDSQKVGHDTNVRYLNDFSISDHGEKLAPSHLTKVPVSVPSVTMSTSQKQHSTVSSRTGHSEGVRSNGLDHQMKSHSGYSGPKLKDILKSSNPNNEGLSKVRELIEKQKNVMNGVGNEEQVVTRSKDHLTDSVPELPQRILHNPDEPVRSQRYDVYLDQPPPIPARKIATGCRVPSYRGFSETEPLRDPSKMQAKMAESRRKTSKPSSQPQLQIATHAPGPKHQPREERKTSDGKSEESKKMTRLVAQKRPAKSEVITTHSWREGQKAILKELGPQKIAKMSSSPPTTDRDTQKTEHCSRHTKKHSHTDHSKMNGHSQTALSAEAQSVLADLHGNKSDEENNEERSKTQHKSSRRKRSKTPEKETSEKPLTKIRHYDSNEVRKYIAKQRAEKKRKQQEEEERRRKEEEARNKMLKELYKKQKACARASQPKSDNLQFKLEPPDPKQRAMVDTDKDSLSGDSSGNSTLTEVSREKKTSKTTSKSGVHWAKEDANRDILLRKYLGSSVTNSEQSDLSENSLTKKPGQLEPDVRLKAEEIVKRITEKSGLSVDDFVNKFAYRAEAIKSTFMTQHDPLSRNDKLFTSRDEPLETSLINPPKNIAAKLDRIQAIKNIATSLQTRVQLESQRLASAVPLIADKWNKPKDDSDFVSRYQLITGRPENVFDNDVPGVRNLHSLAEKSEEEGTKIKAATKIQAAFRGHNVRQGLAWRYPEHKTVGYKLNNNTRKEFHSSDSDGLSDSTLTEESLPDDGHSKKPSVVPPYIPARGIKPSKPIPSWDQQTPDPYTFYSVYSRKKNMLHKPRIPTPPLSDDDEEMRELTEPPPPPPVPIIPIPFRARKPRAMSPGSDVSDTASSVQEDLAISDQYNEDFTGHESTSQTERSQKRNKSSDQASKRMHGDGVASEDDNDSLNRTLTESTSSEASRKLKDPSQSHSLVLSSKKNIVSTVDKEIDWSDVSSLTDESETSFRDAPSQAKLPHTKLNYHGNQWSPGVLHHHMTVELNYLESVQESIQQLAHVERTRGIALAQQETVSLAQVLKARQQAHAIDIAEVQIKAKQESLEVVSQLQNNQQASAAAGPNDLSKLDHSTQYSLQERSQYSRTNSQYSYTEEQAVSYTSESYDSSYTRSLPSNKADSKKSLETGSLNEVKTADDLSKSSTSTIKTATISTASDLSGDKKSTDSSVCTESGVKNDVELSQTESVPEEIGSEHDYTADFDTEEELECSLREMLPSEGQRKKLKRQTSKDLSLLGDDSLFPAEDQASSRRLSFEEDSFSRFNVDMVRQYLRDDEIRERHQHALLKLREQALVEKTKAELAWLEQQKKQIKSKGADDAYPRLKQKERGIIRRLKQEQAELKRLQEVQREASRKRLLMLKESQEIVKIQKSAQHVRQRLKEPVKSSISLSEIAGEVATDEEDLDGGSLPTSPSKEKSDSEIAESFHKLKLMTLNKKYMTRREKKLQQRREMANLEKQKTSKRKAGNSESAYEMTEGADTLQLTTPRTPRTQDSIQESIHTEMTDRSRQSTIPEELASGADRKSTYTSISEEISTTTPSTVKKSQFTSISERLLAAPSSVRTKSCLNTATDTSIQEETQNETETNVSVNVDYTNDTFESEPVQTENGVSKSKDPSTSLAANKSSRRTDDNGFGIGLHTPSNNNNNFHKTSESESEDSFSVAPSETSDSSDVKARIRELSEELKRRKIEAERLKRQHEQRQKEKLREKEEYLRKQIENYNNYISHVKTELNHGLEIPDHQGAPKRPQIKPQSHAITKTTDRPKSVDKTGHQDVDVSASTSAAASGLSRISKDKAAPPKENEVVKESMKSLPPSRDNDVTGSISEEIIEAVVTSTAKSELKLDVLEEEDKVEVATPRSVHESRLDTARSVTEIPEDLSVHTDRSERSQRASPRLDEVAESPRQTSSKKSESSPDENGELSEGSHTEKSTSYRSESSACLEKSKSYTDDYTDDSESSTTISTHTPHSRTLSERSVAQTSRAKSVTDPQKSIPTQDDISESLTEELESEEQSKSEVLFKLDDVPKAEVADGLPDVDVGDRVSVGGRVGTLRFRDFVRFAPGLHAGIELDSPEGDHDGTMEGVQYFTCPSKHGVIVPLDQIARVEQEAPKTENGKDVVGAVEETQPEAGESIGDESDVRGTPRMDDVSVSVSDTKDEPSKSESISLHTATLSEAKDAKTDDIHTDVRTTDSDVKDDSDLGLKAVESEVKADRTEGREKECEKATDLAVQNLLNEAISQMMTIRQQKRVMLQKASHEDAPTTDGAPDSHQAQDVLIESIAEQTPRPLSPQNYRTDEFLDDDIYDFNNDGEDPWNDDDLGFGLSRKPSPAQAGVIGADELKLDLSKLTEPVQPEQVLYVVPHTEPDVSRLVSDVVDVFWERRRYGESWSNVEPPPSYYAAGESDSEPDLHTRRVYKRLVFDLTAHILREMYEEEEEDDDDGGGAARRPAWMRRRLPRFGCARRRLPPTTVDSLKPIVERQVCQLLGLRPEPDGSQARRWSSRKKKDRVDQILVQELRHDEPQWVSYDDDELAVKMQLTNALFDSLIADTAEALKPAFARWSQKLAASSSS